MTLTIHHPEVRRDGEDTSVLIKISDHDPVEFRIRGQQEIAFDPTHLGNLCLAIGLMPAMRRGQELVIEAPVSEELLRNADTLQQIYHRWYRDPLFEKIKIHAQAAESPTGQGDGTACFFSGGVDSLHSVQLHREEITELVFVHGFDIPPGEIGQAELVRHQLEDAADAIGLPVTEVWTDLRTFSEQHCWWGYHYFGAALAAVAQLLSPKNKRTYIPGSCAYEMLLPWGSHVLTDPLWSTDPHQIIHDGAGFTRMDKTEDLASWEIAQRFLRVCWEGPPGSYNCGKCEKCSRTQAALRACGKLDKFGVFENGLNLESLAAQRAPIPEIAILFEDILTYAREKNTDPELIDALQRSVRGTQAELTVKSFAKNNTDAIATDNWQRILPKIRNKLFKSISDSDREWFVQRLEKILPEERDAILALLHKSDHKWLKKAIKSLKR